MTVTYIYGFRMDATCSATLPLMKTLKWIIQLIIGSVATAKFQNKV